MTPSVSNLAPTQDPPARPGPDETWLTEVLEHIREEYDDMPGLCLTLPQAQRPWGLDADTCRRALATLVEAGYLRPSAFGYMRV